jgi:hypothetical protein
MKCNTNYFTTEDGESDVTAVKFDNDNRQASSGAEADPIARPTIRK